MSTHKQKILVYMPFGSHLYGLQTPSSDRDFKGVFMPTKEEIYLNKIPQNIKISSGDDHKKNTAADVDAEIFSLHHFMKLACSGQTEAMDMLHGGIENFTQTSSVWSQLVLLRKLFYTSNMSAFVGYARKQAAKYGVKGSRLDSVQCATSILSCNSHYTIKQLWLCDLLFKDDNSYIHIERDEFDNINNQLSYWSVCDKKMTFGSKASHYLPMMQKYYDNYGKRAVLASQNQGVDWKAISHALRAGFQTKHIFLDGTYSYPLPETEYLLKVKTGQLDYSTQVAPYLDDLIDELERLSKVVDLPQQVDRTFWDGWLCGVIERELNS